MGSSSVGGGQIGVFEVQLPEGEGSICTFDVSWSGSPKNIEMVLYDADTGSEAGIVVKKLGENKYTFTETSGRKNFYLYVEELEMTNDYSGFSITTSFEMLNRLNFSGNVATDETNYGKGTKKSLVIGLGDESSQEDLKYTINLSTNACSFQVYDAQGNVVELQNGSFTIPAGTEVRDYVITVVCDNLTGNVIATKCTLTITQESVTA